MLKRIASWINIYALVFVMAFFVIAGVASYFSVKEINIEGVHDVKGIERFSGKILFFLHEDAIADELIALNPSFASVTAFKHYPDSLYVTARESRPIVAVTLADGTILVREDGSVVAKNRSQNATSLPTITYYQPLFFNQFTIGEKVSEKGIIAAAGFGNLLLDLGIGVTSIDITNENMIVLHTDNFSVLITSEKDILKQFKEFSFTYKELTKAGSTFQSIDVRFEKPVIKLVQ